MAGLTFKKATKKQAKARIALDGPSGAGKTYTALIAAQVLAQGGRVAVIDTERGSASLYSDEFDFDVLELNSFSPQLYIDAIAAAEQAGYTVIVIDSLSHAWEGEGGALEMVDKAAARLQGNSYAAWKDVTPLHRRLVDSMLQSPAHIVATMRSKMDYVQEKDERGKTIIRKVGMAPIQRAGMEYEFTLVGDLDVDHTLVVSKTRCKLLADAVERRPGPQFFQKFLDWLNSGEMPEAPAEREPAQGQVPAEPPKATAAASNGNGQGKGKPKPMDPGELLSRLQAKADEYAQKLGDAPLPAGERSRLAQALNAIVGEDLRHRLLWIATKKESITQLSQAQGQPLLDWLGIPKSGTQTTRATAHEEAALLLAAHEMDPGPEAQQLEPGDMGEDDAWDGFGGQQPIGEGEMLPGMAAGK